MRRALVSGLFALAVAAAARSGADDAAGVLRGVWTAHRSRWNVEGSGPTTLVQLRLQRQRDGDSWSHGFPVAIGELKGLSGAQAESSGGPLRFELVRDAGVFVLDGSFVAGDGAGHFAFTPSAGYREELSRMGYGAPDAAVMFSLAIHDVSRAFIRDLASLGYAKLGLDELQAMAIHGATPAFIRDLRSLGYSGVPVDDLVSLRIHGARPEFIRELRSLGYDKVSVEDLVALRIHGATPAYIRELKALGYPGVPVEDLVAMRIHGVTPEFVRVANRGGRTVAVEQLVEMRIHGQDQTP